ncbi:MAG TPA: hypothetical protein VGD98_08625 [Ktedonobacteraceae bacterium]
MATQEERLIQVESGLQLFKDETTRAYGEMAMELAMLKGLAESSGKRLVTIEKTVNHHTALLDTMDRRLDKLEEHMGSLQHGFGEQGQKLDEQGQKLDEILLLLNALTSKPDQGA